MYGHSGTHVYYTDIHTLVPCHVIYHGIFQYTGTGDDDPVT